MLPALHRRLKAAVMKCTGGSHTVNMWFEECRQFCHHLRERGRPARAIDATFREVCWNQRSRLLEPKVTSQAVNFSAVPVCGTGVRSVPS